MYRGEYQTQIEPLSSSGNGQVRDNNVGKIGGKVQALVGLSLEIDYMKMAQAGVCVFQ
jgi:hypothetical protein